MDRTKYTHPEDMKPTVRDHSSSHTHLQLDDGSALILGHPDSGQVLETDESVGQVGETIAHQV